jgi:hypothetical protein
MRHDMRFRCSSIGKLMTEPVQVDPRLRTPEIDEIIAKRKRTDAEKAVLAYAKERTLSEGAKTHIRELAAQDILGIDFEIYGKPIEKGLLCEDEAIAMVGRVRGLDLKKNKERRQDNHLTGECDVFPASREGRDTKVSWSAATFPITVDDCRDALYEYQMRGYMRLWDAPRWHVDYVLLDTPTKLIGFEPLQMHIVSHIPEHQRVTTWTVERDLLIEALMLLKVEAARRYYAEVIADFDRSHRIDGQMVVDVPPPWSNDAMPAPPAAEIHAHSPAEVAAPDF